MNNPMLKRALKLFKSSINGYEPDGWFVYRNAIVFRAYPEGCTEEYKKKSISPFYMVDLISGKCGNISPAFDLDNFMKAAEKMKSI